MKTSEEISEMDEQAKSEKGWLRLIAYYLAVLVESKQEPKPKRK